MIKSEKHQRICDKYAKPDAQGKVHCYECPLRVSKGDYDFRCRANAHYDRSQREWIYD